MTLEKYLEATMAKEWAWGEHDCSAWPAKWAGVPLPYYDNEIDAIKLIGGAGGLVDLWDKVGEGYIERVDTPQPGDIGVLRILDRAHSEFREIGGIYSGKRWLFIPIGQSIAATQEPALAIWRPVCRRC